MGAPRQQTYAVGTDAILIAEAREGNRQGWYVRNTSVGAQTLTISEGTSGTVGVGYLLKSSGDGSVGEWVVITNGAGFFTYQGEIWAIASAVGGTLVIVEEFYSTQLD